MKYLLILSFSCCLVLGQAQNDSRILNPEFDKNLESLLSHKVPEISCEELFKTCGSFILVDTRERNEYNISHLKNAQWVGYNSFDTELLKGLPKSTRIVCYCSVGYRSERVTKKLMDLGYSNVYNLYGSIFEWINRGYPVYDPSGKEVWQVHGYNKKWSRWVFNKAYRVVY